MNALNEVLIFYYTMEGFKCTCFICGQQYDINDPKIKQDIKCNCSQCLQTTVKT